MTKKIETIETSRLSALLMLSGERIRQLGNDGILVKTAHGQYDMVASCHGYFQYLRVLAYGPVAAEIIGAYAADICRLEAKGKKLEGKSRG